MTNRIFSDDNAKAEKAGDYGYLNIIHYLAPADIAGVGDVCSHRSPACTAACLGWFSGHAAMVKDVERDRNATRDSRIDKTRAFMTDRRAYFGRMVREIEKHLRRATAAGKKLCVRLNGSSDIAWEGIRYGGHGMTDRTLFEIFPHVQFVDYTKNPKRFDRALPKNYSLTFSRSETNEATARALLARNVNVAVVFAGAVPASWNGYPVIDGDAHDLRMLDPIGCVVGLSPKGRKAKEDVSGFVVR